MTGIVTRALLRTMGRVLAGVLARRGNGARAAGRHRDAAALYAESLRLRPDNVAIRIQCGHMYKEAGELEAAEEHYLAANAIDPADAEVALQLGHFYNMTGRLGEAASAFRRAGRIRPDWDGPARELERIRERRPGDAMAEPGAAGEEEPSPLVLPELLPRPAPDTVRRPQDGVVLHHIGRPDRETRGPRRVLRGVEALRGFCVAATPIVELEVLLGDALLCRGAVHDAVALDGTRFKSVFNLWHDFSGVPLGPQVLTLLCKDGHGTTQHYREAVVVAAPLAEADHPFSDAIVSCDPGDGRPLDRQIAARASLVRDARRSAIGTLPRAVLVQRVDQLGDLVCSVPAIRRLRALFPQARLIGLLTAANAELAAALHLFDEVVVADFRDDPAQGRRTMTVAEQIRLRRMLAARDLDLAVDLSEGGNSRPLLLLSGAKVLYGFRPEEFPWLTAGVNLVTRDAGNRLDFAPHGAKLVGLIEALGALYATEVTLEPGPRASAADLAPFGLAAGDRFVVLHTGARLAFSRWPGFAELATLIIARTGLKVLMFSDEPRAALALPPDLLASARLTVIDSRPPFALFDALLSRAAAFVGNDSGPKHLASLRSTSVIGLHTARHNWREWAQTNGLVVSRKVPCAGCGIHLNPEDCGRGFACITDIRAEEVFAALTRLLDAGEGRR